MVLLICLAFLLLPILSNASFSLCYYNPINAHAVIINAQQYSFHDSPNEIQIADMYTRLSGLDPILFEANLNLPAFNPFSTATVNPIILEVHGGSIPKNVVTVVNSAASLEIIGPKLNTILKVLNQHGVEVEHFQLNIMDNSSTEVEKWLAHQTRPVVLLHYDTPNLPILGQHRMLSSNSSSNSTYIPLTEYQISQYQICLWTAVLFVLLVLGGICSIIQMEVIPDSLLFAKFQSGRTGGKMD